MYEPFKLSDLDLLDSVPHYKHPFVVYRMGEDNVHQKQVMKDLILKKIEEDERERQREALIESDIERNHGKLSEEEKNRLLEEKKKMEEGMFASLQLQGASMDI